MLKLINVGIEYLYKNIQILQNIFLVADMNFNQVYKEVSRTTPIFLVLIIVMCCNGEPTSSSMCLLLIGKSTDISFLLSFPFRFVRLLILTF